MQRDLVRPAMVADPVEKATDGDNKHDRREDSDLPNLSWIAGAAKHGRRPSARSPGCGRLTAFA
jgi:hypothetical protein